MCQLGHRHAGHCMGQELRKDTHDPFPTVKFPLVQKSGKASCGRNPEISEN